MIRPRLLWLRLARDSEAVEALSYCDVSLVRSVAATKGPHETVPTPLFCHSDANFIS